METSSLELFARREATTDQTWIDHGPSKPLKRDLVLYSDSERLKEKARVPWNQQQSKNRKYVTINCAKYKLNFN